MNLVGYHFGRAGEDLPAVDEGQLLDYVVASNGVFARGKRPGLEVCMPVSFNLQPVRGLAEVASYVRWGYPKVGADLVSCMVDVSRRKCRPAPLEALFHLRFDSVSTKWLAEFPKQYASAETVIADPAVDNSNVLIELHSHHSMEARFSHTDNLDESQGFRVYAVLGTIFERPSIRSRVGLFGHFFDYAASEFFEIPEDLVDCVAA